MLLVDGEHGREALELLLPLLDGTRSRSAIGAELPARPRAGLLSLLDRLADEGVVEVVGPSRPTRARRSWRRAIRRRPSGSPAHVRSWPATVRRPSPRRALRAAGVGEVACGSDEPGAAAADIVVALAAADDLATPHGATRAAAPPVRRA